MHDLPQAIEAEKHLCSILLLDPSRIELPAVLALRSEDFFLERAREAFLEARRLAGGFCEALAGKSVQDFLVEVSPLAIHSDPGLLEALCTEIRNKARLREIAIVSAQISEVSRNGVADVDTFIERSIEALTNARLRQVTPDDAGAWEENTHAPDATLSSLASMVGQKIEYVIEPMCPRSGVTLLQGAPKSGKSAFSLFLGLCAGLGRTPGLFVVPAPMNVLLLEFEDAPILLANRSDKYMRGMRLTFEDVPASFWFVDFPELALDSDPGGDLLIAKIEERKTDLVIIDTLSHVHQAEDENAAAEMRPLMVQLKRIARKTNCNVLVLHHTAKGDSEKSLWKKGRGSGAIAAGADVIIDWGDRGKTNITPVSVVSKYDDFARFWVEYVPMTTGDVVWKILEDEGEIAGEQKTQKVQVLEAIKFLCLSYPLGVSILSVAEHCHKISERLVYRIISQLEDSGQVSVSQADPKTKQKNVRPILT